MTERSRTPTAGVSVSGDRSAASLAYEQLRQSALASSPEARPLGLVILLREGMLGWLQRRATCAGPVESEPVEPEPASAPAGRSTRSLVTDEIQAGLVRVLASMALGRVNQEQRA